MLTKKVKLIILSLFTALIIYAVAVVCVESKAAELDSSISQEQETQVQETQVQETQIQETQERETQEQEIQTQEIAEEKNSVPEAFGLELKQEETSTEDESGFDGDVEIESANAEFGDMVGIPMLTLSSTSFALNTGDLNCDGYVNSDDAIYLLMHTMFPNDSAYEVNQNVDFDVNGVINSDDAIYLLMHTMFPKDSTYSLDNVVSYKRVYIGMDADETDYNYKNTVQEMQNALIDLGYQGTYGITIQTDGVYTYELMQVIAYYQIVHGILNSDGSATPNNVTWNAIDSEISALNSGTYVKPTNYEKQSLSWNTTNSNENTQRTVRELQFKLKALGYDGARGISIQQDGVWDYDMLRLVSYYQIVNDLSVIDGSISADGETWSSINEQYKSNTYGTYDGFEKYERMDIYSGVNTSSLNVKRTIRELASSLNILGFRSVDGSTLSQDGIYNNEKMAVVKDFQLNTSIFPDTYLQCGGITWKTLDDCLNSCYLGSYEKPSFTRGSIWYGIDNSDKDVFNTIVEVQYKLIELGYSETCGYTIDIDGIYDYELRKTITYYQIVNGIEDPDGSMGSNGTTWNILDDQYKRKVLGENVSFIPYERVYIDINCNQSSLNAIRTIKETEWSLKVLGYTYADGSTITQDGIFGSGMQTVVKKFQIQNGLAEEFADGSLTPDNWTWKKIDSQVDEYYCGIYINLENYDAGTISNCSHDENGAWSYGTAGDQNGDEWQNRSWYDRPWNYVLRYTGTNATEVRKLIAQYAAAAAENNHIGYDQNSNDRYTFWTELTKSNYNPANITNDCETDCSAGVLAIIKAVGYTLGIQALKDVSIYGWTGNEKSILTNAGFTACSNTNYLNQSSYLLAGDVLLNEVHHTAICVANGQYSDDQSGFSDTDSSTPVTTWSVIVTTSSTALNVRSGAGTSYSVISTVAKGSTHTASQIAYDSSGNKWTYLYDVGGWVSAAYITNA